MGTPDEIAAIVEQAASGDRWARRVISSVEQPAARPPLERIVAANDSERLERMAVQGLAGLASEDSFTMMLDLIGSGSHHRQVVRYLARLGTAQGNETLVQLLDHPIARRDAALALGVIGDRRATEPLINLVAERGHSQTPRTDFPRGLRRPSEPLTVLAYQRDPAAVPGLVSLLEDAADLDRQVARHVEAAGDGSAGRRELEQLTAEAAAGGFPLPSTLVQREAPEARNQRIAEQSSKLAMQHLANVAAVLSIFDDPRGDRALSEIGDRLGITLPAPPPTVTRRPEIPVDQCTVPAFSLDFDEGAADHPGTRFGGQPTWRRTPTWPLTPAGTPMAFWAQFEIPWDPNRMAYLFIDSTEGEVWDSTSGTASLIVQPGLDPTVPWVEHSTGPVVPDDEVVVEGFDPPAPVRFSARVPRLEPFNEPEEWPADVERPARTFNKVGGTALALQGSPRPPGDGWRFLFQFGAMEAGRELGDGAECYGFVHEPTGEGYFSWDCH